MDDILKRIKNGLLLLKEGVPYRVGELHLALGVDCFSVSADSYSTDLRYITKSSALNELSEIKQVFNNMVAISSDLKDLINNKKLKLTLYFNYGMGAITVCSEIEGVVNWEIELE